VSLLSDSDLFVLRLLVLEVSIPLMSNHKQKDNSPIKIGIARYKKNGFSNPFERNIVKLFTK
jgi:hypothetical protein